MKIKNILIKFLISFFLIIPINSLAYSDYVIVGGQTIGIEVNSKGVLIVGFYKIGDHYEGKKAGFNVGDVITSVDGKEINSIDEMIENIGTNKKVKFTVLSNNKEKELNMNLVEDEDGVYKTGLYVKDKINGIGTLTYIDPETKRFGALGHEILESTTASKFEIKDGKIYEASVTNIIKSKNGKAGEKNARYDSNNVYGKIEENEFAGIFGDYITEFDSNNKLKVASKEEITTGEATIRTVIDSDIVEEFKINIIGLDDNSKAKNILFEIVDPKLIDTTGGIVQGMSGSPIIQNNKIIGAVNYVIINDTTKGYGIFITTMLEEGDK